MKKYSFILRSCLTAAALTLSLSMPVLAGTEQGNRLKKITYTSYAISGQTKEYGWHTSMIETFEYGGDGRVSVKSTYSGSDVSTVRYTNSYEYDANGYLAKDVLSYRDPAMLSLGFTWAYENDEHGNPLSMTQISADFSQTTHYQYAYDSDGNMVRKEFVFDGKVSSYDIYTYDLSGNIASSEHHILQDGNDIVNAGCHYSGYDSHGNCTGSVSWNKALDSEQDITYIYKYDGNGNMIKRDSISNTGRAVNYYEYE